MKEEKKKTGTTHGSIEKIGDQWYVFYHRLTHASDYSRQSCAEPIQIAADGSIQQVEVSSCGLNGGPLRDTGVYPAVICCNLTNGHMPHGSNKKSKETFPYVNSTDREQFITNIENNTWIGYKYFYFQGKRILRITYCRKGEGSLQITQKYWGHPLTCVSISANASWKTVEISVEFVAEVSGLFFEYQGTGSIDLLEFELGKP